MEPLAGRAIPFIDNPEKAKMRRLTLKRVFDISFSIVALVLLSPLMLALAIYIKLVSRGPVLFVQKRVGLNHKKFDLYKFRNMHVNGYDILNSNTTLCSDPRLIKGGKLIRALKLDELPQFFNVIKGDMSLVGPRPTVEEDCCRMDQRQLKRHNVRPGITGLAQVSGNTSLFWPDRIEHDLEYIEKSCFLLDVTIMVRTVTQIVTGAADTHPPEGREWPDQDKTSQ